jgi:hypothetical protein
MRHPRHTLIALLLLLAACTDKLPSPTAPPQPEPQPEPSSLEAVGRYSIDISGIGGEQMTSSISSAPIDLGDASGALTQTGAGLVFEQVSSLSFTEGPRTAGAGGQRYISFTYRVRNGTAAPLNNLTLLLVSSTGSPPTRQATLPGTAVSLLRKFDGSAANAALAAQVVPTGAVALGSDLENMQGLYPDVLQVLTEAEVGAIAKPADVTSVFPVGYMVRSKNSVANRLLPVAADAHQFDGVLTVSFRLPLQTSATLDVFSFRFEILAVTDSETRVTESIEESQDTAAVRRLRERATALGATTTTVLNGSPAMDPAVLDYPGQRQICSPRTAGTPGSPTTTIVSAASYVQLFVLRPGETVNSCNAHFLGGTPGRPATNVPYTVTLTAMDRYGNMKTSAVDSVRVAQQSGPAITIGAGGTLASGQRAVTVTFSDYGTSLLGGVGRRMDGWQTIPVMGVTRTWTAGAGTTDWHTNGNWSPAAVPMSLDSVIVPLAAPLDPVLAANVAVEGVTVEDGATISLNAFDLTATANVFAGITGGITNTTGRLVLAGTAKTVQGRLPRLRVTGTYSLTGNVTARAPLQVESGRLTNAAFRVQMESF